MLSPAQLAFMQSIVESSLDTTLPVYRRPATSGSTGQNSGSYAFVDTMPCTVSTPMGAQLQAFASEFGASSTVTVRFMPTFDLRQGDRVVYNNRNWTVQRIMTDSYSVANKAVITVVS